MTRQAPAARGTYARFLALETRWMDNDVYGHVNNVVYYSYFDTAVNGYLVEEGLLDVAKSPVVGYVIETGCTFFEPVAFPEALEAGLLVADLGRTSVRYRIGIFKAGGELAAAQGHFVHVYVDRATQRPVEIPAPTRRVLEGLSFGKSAPA